MISDLSIARLAFARSATSVDAMLLATKTRLQVDNANLGAARKALSGAGTPDLEAEQQSIVETLQSGETPTSGSKVDREV